MTSSAAVTLLMVTLVCYSHVTEAWPTTKGIKEIFVGRCHEYQKVVNTAAFWNGSLDCDTLWENFFTAFGYRDGCNVTSAAFDPFIEQVMPYIPQQNLLFWSGVYPFVLKYSSRGQRAWTIGDTLLAYLVDGMSWCGQTEAPGMNHDSCPYWGDCNTNAETVYWTATAKALGGAAIGEARVMLNASRAPAYKNYNFFGQYELPSMSPDKVTVVHAQLVLKPGDVRRERCGAGSLTQLRDDVIAKGLQFKCSENILDAQLLLCADNMDSEDCQTMLDVLGFLTKKQQALKPECQEDTVTMPTTTVTMPTTRKPTTITMTTLLKTTRRPVTEQQTTEGPEEGPGEALEGPEEPAAVIGGSVQEDQPRVDIVTDPPVIGRGEVKVNVTSSNATAKPVSTTATQTTTAPTTTRPPTTTTVEVTEASTTTTEATTTVVDTTPISSEAPTTAPPSSTARPSTARPTTARPSTARPTTGRPTTGRPTTGRPTTAEPSTERPTTARPSTARPSTARASTGRPSTAKPTTGKLDVYKTQEP